MLPAGDGHAWESINCACLNGSHGKIAKNKFDQFTAKYTLRNKKQQQKLCMKTFELLWVDWNPDWTSTWDL
jgi:hypothetical protein